MAKELLIRLFFLEYHNTRGTFDILEYGLSSFWRKSSRTAQQVLSPEERQFRAIMYSTLVGYTLLILVFAAVPRRPGILDVLGDQNGKDLASLLPSQRPISLWSYSDGGVDLLYSPVPKPTEICGRTFPKRRNPKGHVGGLHYR